MMVLCVQHVNIWTDVQRMDVHALRLPNMPHSFRRAWMMFTDLVSCSHAEHRAVAYQGPQQSPANQGTSAATRPVR
jgi:hypothetical protein